MVTKRFFKFDIDGASYWVVAVDLPHARRVLRESGTEFGQEGRPFDEIKENGLVTEQELSHEQAFKTRCDWSDHDDDSGKLHGTKHLTECEVGEWFSSEY
jgi:hypothetical protein